MRTSGTITLPKLTVFVLQLLLGVVISDEINLDHLKGPGRCKLYAVRHTRLERVEPKGDDNTIRQWVNNHMYMALTNFNLPKGQRVTKTVPQWQHCNRVEWYSSENLLDKTVQKLDGCSLTVTNWTIPIVAEPHGFYQRKLDGGVETKYEEAVKNLVFDVIPWDRRTDSVAFSVGDLAWDTNDDAVLSNQNNDVYCIVGDWVDKKDARDQNGTLKYQNTEDIDYWSIRNQNIECYFECKADA